MDIDEILPQIERLSTQDTWGAEATLLVKYHRALEQSELNTEDLLSQVASLEDACEALEKMNEGLEATELAKEVDYLKEKLAIIEPALEVLAAESLEMYNAELKALDKAYEKI